MYTPNDGDIICAKGWNDRETVKVIVKAYGYYATVVCLYDNVSYDNEFELNVGKGYGKLHADLGRLSYTKNTDMEEAELIRSLDTPEYDRLLKGIGKVLGVPGTCTSNSSDKELDALRIENDKLRASLKAAEEEAAALSQNRQESIAEEIAGLQKQLDLLQKEKDKIQKEKEKLGITATKREAEKSVYESLYKELLASVTAGK